MMSYTLTVQDNPKMFVPFYLPQVLAAFRCVGNQLRWLPDRVFYKKSKYRYQPDEEN